MTLVIHLIQECNSSRRDPAYPFERPKVHLSQVPQSFLVLPLIGAALVAGLPQKEKTRITNFGAGAAGHGALGHGGGIISGVAPGNGGYGGIAGGIGVGPSIIPGGGLAAPATCRYWCRTPQGQAYCCEGGNEPAGPVGVKPGNCPQVRPQCPPVRSGFPPNPCSNDYKCGGLDKCCYDVCLEEHVCKPQSYFGR
ncbi:uncharacterized protein [Palaemon carinicauda]|uniref:uncharacterized protein n=1 Tax=Palaemon carinicauda TaxID=392227 RepID=UPI0035B57890